MQLRMGFLLIDLIVRKPSFCKLKYIRNNFLILKTFERKSPFHCYLRTLSTEVSENNDNQSKKDETKSKNKELVFLIGVDGKILGTKTKNEAEQLARKNKWSLIEDTENIVGIKKLPTFKLLTSSQLQDTLNKVEKKSKNQNTLPEKQLTFTSKIGQHDLETKCKTIQKWIKKNISVRLIVTGDEKRLDDVYRTLEDKLKNEARFLQKRVKNGILKVTVTSQATGKKTPTTLTKDEPEEN